MQRALATTRRLLACDRASALVGYTSLMLLFAVAAVAILGHASSGTEPARSSNIISSD